VDAIVCSDKHRSYETALAVHRFHPGVPLLVDAMFREVSRRNIEAHEGGIDCEGRTKNETKPGQRAANPP
jgi:hypothetical protein